MNKTFNKKILVHFHLYYYDQVDYFIEKLSNINSCDWNLFVTYVEENRESFEKIKKLKPDAVFKKVENRGYDVLPFIRVVKSVNLDEYDYILKIHTKAPRDIVIFNTIGYGWRNLLVDALLSSKHVFKKNLAVFHNKKVGMIFSSVVKCFTNLSPYPEDKELLHAETDRLNFKCKESAYCSGTMFFARANIYKFLQNDLIKDVDFDKSKSTDDGASLAHVYERLLCLAVNEFGYDFHFNKVKYKKVYDKPVLKKITEWLFSIKNVTSPKKIHKVFQIFGIKLKLRKKIAPRYIQDKNSPKLKNILLISHELTLTGAPLSLLRLANVLRKNNYDVEVWSLCGGALYDKYVEKGFNPFILKDNQDYISAFYTERNRNFDLIICNTTLTCRAVVALRNFEIPLIWYIREAGLIDKFANDDKLIKEMVSFYKNIYVVSKYAASFLKKRNNSCKIIAEAMEDIAPSKMIKNQKNLSFGIIGTICEPKGMCILIDAFVDLIKTHPASRLYVAGDTNHKFALDLIEKTKQYRNIIWLGQVQDNKKQEFFDNIDVLVSASFDDSFGLTVLEGAMQSKALIVTKNTGANYIVEEGVSGFVVETGSVQAMKNAMEKMFSVDLIPMKKAARAQYEKFGTPEREEKEILKMVEENLAAQV